MTWLFLTSTVQNWIQEQCANLCSRNSPIFLRSFCGLISGAVAVESIFDWPGVGSYAVNAILTSDYKAILAVTLVVGLIYSIVNILVDVVHAWLDPRVAEKL